MQAFKNSKQIKSECILQLEKYDTLDKDLVTIPSWLTHLEEFLFENLPDNKKKELPLKFIKSIPVGFENWTKIYHELCIYLLTDIVKTGNDKKVIKAVEDIITLHNKVLRGEQSNLSSTWSAARSTARSAARSTAWSAARSAAWSAESTAWSAAGLAAESARSAAWSAARSAARSAESTAWSAESTAESTAWSAATVNISDKLLELLSNEQ